MRKKSFVLWLLLALFAFAVMAGGAGCGGGSSDGIGGNSDGIGGDDGGGVVGDGKYHAFSELGGTWKIVSGTGTATTSYNRQAYNANGTFDPNDTTFPSYCKISNVVPELTTNGVADLMAACDIDAQSVWKFEIRGVGSESVYLSYADTSRLNAGNGGIGRSSDYAFFYGDSDTFVTLTFISDTKILVKETTTYTNPYSSYIPGATWNVTVNYIMEK